MATEYLNHIAYDSVVFGFSGETLKILIMEYHNTGMFALPGGFVRSDENLNDAVKRGLHERTGLDNIYLEQFYTFGDVARFQPEVMARIIQANEIDSTGWEWLLERFISVAYYALINYNDVVPQPDVLSDSCEWYAVNQLPPLILDHGTIVSKALETLRMNLDYKLIGGNLLPERFTMQELQNVYEAILGTKLHRSAFQRKLLASDRLIRHEKRFTGKAHKAPYLYSFKPL
ncbi:MAG: NUDIX hydrolase [Saprospiraceae bacterium]|nr:NUDIX hydrolase [Saprospiraceae bacterium]MCB9319906.1 NUDIX hydrolase [Lewinellaceae bacterium]